MTNELSGKHTVMRYVTEFCTGLYGNTVGTGSFAPAYTVIRWGLAVLHRLIRYYDRDRQFCTGLYGITVVGSCRCKTQYKHQKNFQAKKPELLTQ